MENYEKLTLPNGVRILYEKIPYVRSVSAGIWVGTGSRFEAAADSGISHFIEHMVFKGTETRNATELAMLIDGAGGQTDAFTSKESTCFYGKALDSHLDLLLDVLCDMFFNSTFRDEDVESERGVILEEIGMYEDAPEDLCSERLFAGIYKGNSLARPILGKPSTLFAMNGET
ncbi:MAG: insulinase family protein, partial [Oscillospiraceae bacterium]|nr:insulinase family protein [Oscillospiraceae bacterium]